ncbi:hypothetical protein PHMEG_0006096 [Phytophthora megakarya]|uniref:Protein Mpv17 n=1 Tax=Phytophthora megakarya TaxID=4795 RepID=A0A225WPT5_9STRA|nr:hypothetical protein PHMEG_0006096 [Phytophthora megakarya]
MRRLGLLYDGWLRQSPVLTKSVTAAVLFGLGDRIAQRMEKSRTPESDADNEEDEDDRALVSESTARTMRMMMWGSVIFTPILHSWQNLIERAIGSHGKIVVFQKMLMDSLVFAPCINALFFTSTQMVAGKSFDQGVTFAVDRLPQTLQANYTIWPIANMINYSYVPLQYRVLFVNCVNLVWTTVLSTISNRPVAVLKEEVKQSMPAGEQVMEC